MSDQARDPQVKLHVAAISNRTEAESAALAAAIIRRCWPGGAGDRSEPSALEWVRRWGARRTGVFPPACSCKSGRCRVCN